MFFRDIVGQEIAKEELRNSYLSGVVPHARLFVGTDGAGALGLAYAYARYINCANPTPQDACGECPSCKRFSQFSGLDLIHLFPIANVGSRNICEDELPRWREFLASGTHTTYNDWLHILGGDGKRLSIFSREAEKLSERLSYQIAEARYRIILIYLPERLQDVLGARLLKLIEEPPTNTIILMVSLDESAVLGTLRSRMQTIYLRPLDEEIIREQLDQIEPKHQNLNTQDIAHRAGGNYRIALDEYLGKNQDNNRLLDLFKQCLRATVDAQPVRFRSLSDELASLSKDEQLQLLAYFARTFRELFIANYEIPKVSYLRNDEQPIAQYIKACLNIDNVSLILDELDLATRHIAQNVNSKIVFFDLIAHLTAILSSEYKRHHIR